MSKPYRDKTWLKTKYWDEQLTQKQIANRCDVSPRTIRKYMNQHDIPTRDIVGENHPLYGKSRSEETKRKISETLAGREVSEETRQKISKSTRGRVTPPEVREKISRSLIGLTRSLETREKMSRSTAGKNNPNWKGGYSERYGGGWSTARERVRMRDKVCRYCGHDGSKMNLHVHHLTPVRWYRETNDIPLEAAHREENLVLLCNRCHGLAEHGIIDPKPP